MAQRQRGHDRREPAPDMCERRAFRGGHDEAARPEDLQGERDDLVLVAGLLEIQMAGGPARDQGERIRDARHPVPRELAHPLVAQVAKPRPPPSDARVVMHHECSVAGSPDIELDELRLGRDGGFEGVPRHRAAGDATAAVRGDLNAVIVHGPHARRPG
jgi:hypothetical protein